MRHHAGKRGGFLQKLSSQEMCSTSALCWGNKPARRDTLGRCSRSREGWLKRLPPIQVKQFVSEALLQLPMVILGGGLMLPWAHKPPPAVSRRPGFPLPCYQTQHLGLHPIRIHGTFRQTSTPGEGEDASARCLPAAGMLPASGRAHPSFLRNKQRWQTWAVARGRWHPKLRPW